MLFSCQAVLTCENGREVAIDDFTNWFTVVREPETLGAVVRGDDDCDALPSGIPPASTEFRIAQHRTGEAVSRLLWHTRGRCRSG